MAKITNVQGTKFPAPTPAPTEAPVEEVIQQDAAAPVEESTGDLGVSDQSSEQAPVEQVSVEETPVAVAAVIEVAPTDTADVDQHKVFTELSRSLNEFQEATNPAKPFTTGHHYTHEQNLARNLRFLLRSCPDELFDSFWKKVIELFHSPMYNALRPEYIHRDGPMWKEGEDLAIFFTNVVALISVSTMGKVAAKKQINFERAFGGTEEVIRNKLINYYA